MPRNVIWECEHCHKTRTGSRRPPWGWVECSYWTGTMFQRYAFCSYKCLSVWPAQRSEAPPERHKYETA